MKIWLTIEKGARLRFTGHLDLMRAMQRALRRSDLPVRFSNGFNPHMLLTFAAPLPLGMPGRREILEVPVGQDIDAAEFMDRLNRALPPDIRVRAARAVDDAHPAPMALLKAATYLFELDEECPSSLPTFEALPMLLEKTELIALRKTKTGEKLTDIRPLIHSVETVAKNCFAATLALCESGTVKPDLFLTELSKIAGVQKPDAMITRLKLLGIKDGAFCPLEES